MADDRHRDDIGIYERRDTKVAVTSKRDGRGCTACNKIITGLAVCQSEPYYNATKERSMRRRRVLYVIAFPEDIHHAGMELDQAEEWLESELKRVRDLRRTSRRANLGRRGVAQIPDEISDDAMWEAMDSVDLGMLTRLEYYNALRAVLSLPPLTEDDLPRRPSRADLLPIPHTAA